MATLIASGALLLAAAAPVTAHHPTSDPGREAPFSATLDSASDEVDGWESGELDRGGDKTSANTGNAGSQTEQGGTTVGTTTSNDQADSANDDDSADVEDANDADSGSGADSEHAGTSDHGRPHRDDGSDGTGGGQGSTSNG